MNNSKCILKTPKEIMYKLNLGWLILCEWKQDNRVFKTESGQVIRCEGNKILVRHWKDTWFLIEDNIFDLVAYPPIDTKPSFLEWLKQNNIQYPNLGINYPIGASWVACENLCYLYKKYQSC